MKHFTPDDQEPELLKKAEELFAREAKILEQLGKHPQIPQLLAYTQENQDFFIVQEFIPGDDITKELPIGVSVNEDVVMTLLIEILEVLVVIQQQEKPVIHRDLKPSNIRRRETDKKIFIIDFGAVKQISTQILGKQQKNATSIGTPGYRPPGQANGNPKLSSDIYAVGIIGIQALTGKLPRELKRNQDSKLIWRNFVKVSDKFANILDKMVAYHYADRYNSAAEVLIALQEISQPKPKPQPQPKPKPQPQLLLVKISLIGLFILVIGIIGLVLFQRSISECDGKLAVYQSSENQISLKYPECWNPDNTPNAFTGKFLSLNQPETKTKIIIRRYQFSGTLEELRDENVKQIENNIESGEVVNTQQTYFLNKKGIKIIATGKLDDEEIKNMYVMTLNNNIAYEISYSATKDDFEKFLKTAETTIKSVKIQKD